MTVFFRTLWSAIKEVKPPFVFDVVHGIGLDAMQRNQASFPFKALNSACLSKYQKDVSHLVEMSPGPRAFSRVSTGDSDIPSSCEMKDEPAFKPLQGIPTFFLVRTRRCAFHSRQQTQGPSHIPIGEGSLHLV